MDLAPGQRLNTSLHCMDLATFHAGDTLPPCDLGLASKEDNSLPLSSTRAVPQATCPPLHHGVPHDHVWQHQP
ncbi:hypothetical protein E2562_038162 [Oryza meyeriana var. granulata]|uniref:Uncharacterized protein n=1 Tax=Oryza meyeriana var. granulata TaxID=110450 RepID=A0A6G1CMX1_9ORYZ|nr:hypothetical protein E2562_038162 [Oryza meyeriana var. granulata]